MANPVKFFQQSPGRFLIYPLLLIIPLILFITSLDTIKSRDKAWYAGGYDPEYAYLFNALNMAEFKLAGHVDHPGTTIQVAGGVVLKVAWWIDPRGEDLTTAVLSDPEHYIRILNITAAVIGSLTLLLLGWFLTVSTGSIWIGILLQLTPFISGYVLFNGFTRITQEVMQMSAAFAMAALTLQWYFNNKNGHKINYTFWFAVVAGFGMASKFIFIPLLVIPFILLDGWKRKFTFVGMSVLAFLVFTLPVIKMYPSMFKWILSLLTHTGQYGSGGAGVIDSSVYLVEMVKLFRDNPYLFGIFMLSLVVLGLFAVIRLQRKRFPDPAAARVLAAVVVAQAVGYLLVAKHPKPSYLLSYECITAINVVVVLHLALSLIPRKGLRYWVMGLITIVVAVTGIQSGLARKQQLYGTDLNWEYAEIWGAATNANQKYAIVCINPGVSPMAGLFFGNAYSHSRYVPELRKIYPDFYILDAYNNRIIHWGGDPVSPDELFRRYNGNLMILNTPLWVEPDAGLINLSDSTGWKMTEVYTGRGKLLAPVQQPAGAQEEVKRKVVFNSAETAGPGQTEIRTMSNATQGDVGILSFDQAHSGHSCVMATAEKPYAFGIEESGVQPGEIFSVGVWVFGDAPVKDIVLVGSAYDSGEFYISSAEVIAVDAVSGWRKIGLEFMVNKAVTGGVIKVYVWNAGKVPVYLDDFRCERISPVINDNLGNE